jgi:hypothetical protein
VRTFLAVFASLRWRRDHRRRNPADDRPGRMAAWPKRSASHG